MNIFVLNKDTKLAAKNHCDKHVVKMILETAQLLSTAHHILGSSLTPYVYKSTHKNHPSAVWVRSGDKQYQWAFSLFEELLLEYTHRYNKTHATARLLPYLSQLPDMIHRGGEWTDPPQCMYDECRTDDTVEAYRNYYKVRQGEIDMRWTNREIPAWL